MSKFLFIQLVVPLLVILFSSIQLQAQCGCSSSQQFLHPLHWLGAGEISVSEKKRLRIDLMYKFAAGENLYNGTKVIPSETQYKFHFIDFFASYGITNYTAIDFSTNYNYRALNQYNFKTNGYGFSNLSFGLRHTIFESENSDLIVNFGAGAKVPLMSFKPIDKYPIVVQPSNGAFGFYSFGILQKSFPKYFLNLLLFSRFDYNFKNNQDYQFAPTLSTSLFLSRRFTGKFVALVEFRNSYLLQDKDHDTIYSNSGANLFFLVPRITFSFDQITISPFAEMPIYQNYKGEQIGSRFSLGINFNYVINFAKRKF